MAIPKMVLNPLLRSESLFKTGDSNGKQELPRKTKQE
jgi:hypothetical protein